MSKIIKQYCQECGTELERMVTIGADKSFSGKTERLYLCRKCLSTWEIIEQEDGSFQVERYFFG